MSMSESRKAAQSIKRTSCPVTGGQKTKITRKSFAIACQRHFNGPVTYKKGKFVKKESEIEWLRKPCKTCETGKKISTSKYWRVGPEEVKFITEEEAKKMRDEYVRIWRRTNVGASCSTQQRPEMATVI